MLGGDGWTDEFLVRAERARDKAGPAPDTCTAERPVGSGASTGAEGP